MMLHILVNIKTNLHKHPDPSFQNRPGQGCFSSTKKNLHKHPGPAFQIRPGQGYFSSTGKTYTNIPALL